MSDAYTFAPVPVPVPEVDRGVGVGLPAAPETPGLPDPHPNPGNPVARVLGALRERNCPPGHTWDPARLEGLVQTYGLEVVLAVVDVGARTLPEQQRRGDVMFDRKWLELLSQVPPTRKPAPRDPTAADLAYHGPYPPEHTPGADLGHKTLCDGCMRWYPAVVGDDGCATAAYHAGCDSAAAAEARRLAAAGVTTWVPGKGER